MRILILTQYYPPETGAAQNRLHALARRLQERGALVSVLTAMPNYPAMKVMEGYRHRCYKKDVIDGITIHRSWIYVKNSKSILLRLMNYFSFVLSSLFTGIFRVGKYDYLICESPPLFLGITAYLLSRIKGAGMIFNVSDLWPESAEKLGLIRSRTLLRMSTWLEEFLYRKSVLVTGQTQGIVNNIARRFPHKEVSWLPNGSELAYFQPEKHNDDWRVKMGYSKDDFLVFYGGIFGHAQGLEVVLHAARRLKGANNIHFILMGNGPLEDELVAEKETLSLNNIHFYQSVSRNEMPGILASIDISVIPLRNLELFRGAIPSKIFESLAMKKPILLGVEGEAKELFIEEGLCGLAFEPENDAMLAEKILLLKDDPSMIASLGENARNYVSRKFDRDRIADRFYLELERLSGKK